MAIRFPGESPEYRAARERLLQREIELRRAAEAAAQERRALPPGGVVAQDYVFEAAGADGAAVKVRLSELFGKNDSLAIYSYMFGPERERPCPMCTPLLDGLDGVEEHIRQRVTLVVVAESPIARLVAFAKERGWRRLRLVSAAGNTYNRDYHGKGERGGDTTMLNVFHRTGETIRHFWGSELSHGPSDPGQDHRGLDINQPDLCDVRPDARGARRLVHEALLRLTASQPGTANATMISRVTRHASRSASARTTRSSTPGQISMCSQRSVEHVLRCAQICRKILPVPRAQWDTRG